MKTTGIFVLASLLSSSLVVAAPLEKRDIVWVTKTAEVVQTVAITTTIWVDAANYRAQPTGGQFYGRPHRSQGASSSAPSPTSGAAPSTSAAAPVISSSSSVDVPSAAPSTPSTPSTPSVSSTPSTPSATSSSIDVAPVPTSTYVPPPPVTTETPVAPSTTEVPPPVYNPPSSSSAVATPSATPPSYPPGQTIYTGDITHYDVGLGSCGWTSTTEQAVVALPRGMMKNPANPNNNPLCGHTITISYSGIQTVATIVDTCGDCENAAIDLSDSVFTHFAPLTKGRLPGVNWWFNN